MRRLYGIINRRAQHLFFQNEEDLAVFRETGMLGTTPHTLLPGSGIDLEHFSPVPLPAQGPVTFIMIARLLGDKGVRMPADKESHMPVRCCCWGRSVPANLTAI